MRKEQGITLIALIITIIVMLILVGVTVAFAMNGGLFRKAKEASDKTILAKDIEELTVAVAASYGSDGELHFDGADGLDVNAVAAGFEKKSRGVYLKDGYAFKVDRNGKITVVDDEPKEFTLAGLIGICDKGEIYYTSLNNFTSLANLTEEELADDYVFDNAIDFETDSENLISMSNVFVQYAEFMMSENGEDQEAMAEFMASFTSKYIMSINTYGGYINVILFKIDSSGEQMELTDEEMETVISTYGNAKITLKTYYDIVELTHNMGDHIDMNNDGLCDICDIECSDDGKFGCLAYRFEGNYATVINAGEYLKIIIPSTVTYNGQQYTVNAINSAFYHNDNVKFIDIPNTVTTIGEHSFTYCDALESITFPSSVTSIDSRTFYECPNLKTITVTGKTSGSISGAPWMGDGWNSSVEPTPDCVRVVWSDQTDYYVYGTNNGNGGGGGNQSNQGNGS